MVCYFFSGNDLPRYMTHTCIVMIPKVDNPESLSELRPISLANVSSKIISKMLNTRLTFILPKIITPNQFGFIIGRAITNNIMLTQEMVHNMTRDKKGLNVIFKLDVSKAYDRVSWKFLW